MLLFLKQKSTILVASCVIFSSVCTPIIVHAAYTAATTEALNPENCVKGNACGGCLTVQTQASGDPPKGEVKFEECPQGKVWFADCYCKNKKTNDIQFEQPGYTYAACESLCKGKEGIVNPDSELGRHKDEGGSGGGSSAGASRGVNALCFTPQECTDNNGTFEGADKTCPGGRGKCIAPEPSITLSSPVLGQTSITGLRNYIPLMFNYALSISIVVASVMFVYAGFSYIYSGGSKDVVGLAQERMINAVAGLVLLFGAQAILATLNPATLKLDKLTVHMINPQSFLNQNFCKDFKKADGSTPKLGSTGTPPGSLDFEKANFNTSVAEAGCNSEFYAEGFPLNKCMGDLCKEAGKVCVPCKASIEECKEKDSKTYVCASQAFGGMVHYENDHAPMKMYMLPVCNWIQGTPFNSKKVSENMPEAIDMNLTQGGGSSGDTYYRMFGDKEILKKIKESCKSGGGLRGVVIGVIYKDPTDVLGGAAAAASSLGKASTSDVLKDGGMTVLTDAVIDGLSTAVKADDVAIVSKKDCGTTGKFYGYTNGTVTSRDSTDMRTAFYCGSVVDSTTQAFRAFDGSTTGDTSLFWTEQELDDAFNGSKPLECNFALTSATAPSNPGTALQKGCAANWCSPQNPKCN